MSASAVPHPAASVSQNNGGLPQITPATTLNSSLSASYPPRPPGVPSGRNGRRMIISFNDDWEGYYALRGSPTAIRIRHNAHEVRAELVHSDLTPAGKEFFRGEFEPNSTIAHGLVKDLNGIEATMVVPGWRYRPRYVRHDRSGPSCNRQHRSFQRISLAMYNDTPCSSGNEMKVGTQSHS